MNNKFFRITLLFSGLIVFSGLSIATEDLPAPLSDKQTGSSLDDLSFSSCDQNESHDFLSSLKEDITAQYNQHKVKFVCANPYQSAIINYRFTHLFYQSVLARSFTLGRTTALRAPPSISLS